MSLQLTEEQIGLRDSVRRFLSQRAPLSYVRQRFEGNEGHDAALLKDLAELGLAEYFTTPRAEGGGGMRELGLLAFEAGFGLATEPFVESLFAGIIFVEQLLSPAHQKQLDSYLTRPFCEEVRAGKVMVAVAPPTVCKEIVLDKRGNGPHHYRLTGKVPFVAGADRAQFLMLAVEQQLFLCDLYTGKEQRTVITLQSNLDRTEKRFQIELANVSSIAIDGCSTVTFWQLLGILKANELAGIAARTLEMTIDYAKTRKQFDAPIGSFQAVQHKIADCYVQSEATHALADFAAWSVDNSPEQLTLSSLSAISFAVEQVPAIVEHTIQLHGGIGFTWEYDLHLYLRRAKSIEALYGAAAPADAVLSAAR